MRKIGHLFFLILLAPLFVFALNARTNEVISVPTAEVLDGGSLCASFYNSVAMKFSEDRVGYDYNFSLSYGILGFMDASLHMYTYKDYAAQIQVKLLSQSFNRPAVSFGIKNITYERYIDEGGGGDGVNSGLSDYAYLNRSSDVLSAYVVATEDLGKLGKYTLGIGRGEFVGYGRGRYLSTVAFMDAADLSGSAANEFMFSLFGGAEIPLAYGISIKGDVDGRDVNAGVQYRANNLTFNAAVTHLELFTASDINLRPRIEIGMNCIFDFLSGSKTKKESGKGSMVINIIDSENDEPVDGIVEFVGAEIEPVFVEDGNKKIELPAGRYTLKVMSDDCLTLTREAEVKANETGVIFFDMESVEKCGTLTGRIVDRTTETPIIPEIEIEGVDAAKIDIDRETGIYKVTLMPGTYTVKAFLEGYTDWINIVVVEEDKTSVSNINMLKKGGRVSLKNVNFESGSSDLTKESLPILDDVVLVLKANKDVRIEIQGFTDSVGKASANLSLSQERTESVKDYLVSRGIEEQRIQTKGFGETMNIADNETDSNRAKNRRIEFVILE